MILDTALCTVIKNLTTNPIFLDLGSQQSSTIPAGGTVSIPGDVTSGVYGMSTLEALTVMLQNGSIAILSTPLKACTDLTTGTAYYITVDNGAVVLDPVE